MAQITVNLQGVPQGRTVEIPGLGAFENGSTHDVDDNKYNAYTEEHEDFNGVFGEPLGAGGATTRTTTTRRTVEPEGDK